MATVEIRGGPHDGRQLAMPDDAAVPGKYLNIPTPVMAWQLEEFNEAPVTDQRALRIVAEGGRLFVDWGR